MIGAFVRASAWRTSSTAAVVKTRGVTGPSITSSSMATTLSACCTVVMNGIRVRSKIRSGNWMSSALPIVSALMPVLSERKKTGTTPSPGTSSIADLLGPSTLSRRVRVEEAGRFVSFPGFLAPFGAAGVYGAGVPDASYLPIAHHGLIGDLRTCALVGSETTIDWFCAPRFDSPSIFGALLDPEKGGYWRLEPVGAEATTSQFYFPDSNILVTRLMTEQGVAEVHDFMPLREGR